MGKIPSGEATNKPFLEEMSRAFDRLILSTGMCSLSEVQAAVAVLRSKGTERQHLTILHCNTEYPTPFEDVNLAAMATLADSFECPVGYSDHTVGIEVPIAAVALGATVIEKHLTLDRAMEGPDHAASLEPSELGAMVAAIRNIEVAIGDGEKTPSPSEEPNRRVARKSIHVALPIAENTVVTRDALVMLRPGDGLSPMEIDEVVGRTAARELVPGDKLQAGDLR